MSKRPNQWRGCADLVYAKLTADTATELTYGEVKELAYVKNIGRTFEQSSETVFADNGAVFTTVSAGQVTKTFECLAIDDAVVADITGQYSETGSSLIVNKSSARPPYVAVGYKIKDTDGQEYYVWAFKGTFATPERTVITEDNGTQSDGQTLTFTAVQTLHKFTKTGAGAVDMCINSADEAYNVTTFFDDVTTPDTLVSGT